MATIGRGSQIKGADFEREIAQFLSKYFIQQVKRTPSPEKYKWHSGDLGCRDTYSILARFHWELKKREAGSIYGWYHKAEDDAETLKIPVVVFSKNRESNYVCLSLTNFCGLLKELEGFLKINNK